MQKTGFPYPLFLILLVLCTGATFITANTMSVKTYTAQDEMITPFPVAMELSPDIVQVVTDEQLAKLQLPDPETGNRLIPRFNLAERHFINGVMPPYAIVGTSITNGNNIHIPTNYSAEINGTLVDGQGQEITLIYSSGENEDQIITAIYTVRNNETIPQKQYVKNVLIWKSIFMNGMMLSLILAFVICKQIVKRRTKNAQIAP
jgi:hypothetical protein